MQLLQEALQGKMRLFGNKPHQSVVGTIESIVDVYSKNPNNDELKSLIPKVFQYLDNWSASIKADASKKINEPLMEKKILTLKETINKTNDENGITL